MRIGLIFTRNEETSPWPRFLFHRRRSGLALAHTCPDPPACGWTRGLSPAKVVKTHCCFCGQQCGIQLLVKENQVIGFEPWMEFPFNQGKLCSKGIKRYLQDAHPDRLLHAYERDPSAPGPTDHLA